MIKIRRYKPTDEIIVFKLLLDEGDDWVCYTNDESINNYKNALNNSITYLAFEDNNLCGYARCKTDDGFGVYVYDLLVAKPYRGNGIGRKLMEQACIDFPNETVYVMSDVDAYYKKLGYEKEGSIFVVKKA